MTDCILIQNGRAHEIWRGKKKVELPPLHPDLLANVVEVETSDTQEGDVWKNRKFTRPVADEIKKGRRPLLMRDGLTDDELSRLKQYLVATGILTEDRANEVFG